MKVDYPSYGKQISTACVCSFVCWLSLNEYTMWRSCPSVHTHVLSLNLLNGVHILLPLSTSVKEYTSNKANSQVISGTYHTIVYSGHILTQSLFCSNFEMFIAPVLSCFRSFHFHKQRKNTHYCNLAAIILWASSSASAISIRVWKKTSFLYAATSRQDHIRPVSDSPQKL